MSNFPWGKGGLDWSIPRINFGDLPKIEVNPYGEDWSKSLDGTFVMEKYNDILQSMRMREDSREQVLQVFIRMNGAVQDVRIGKLLYNLHIPGSLQQDVVMDVLDILLRNYRLTLVASRWGDPDITNKVLRPISAMDDSHLLHQIQCVLEKGWNLNGFAHLIMPKLQNEACKRGLANVRHSKKESKKMSNFNLNNAPFLVRDDILTVSCHHVYGENRHEYTYVVPAELAKQVKAHFDAEVTGDNDDVLYGLVQNQRGLSIVSLDLLHEEPQIDEDSEYTYTYIFQLVDRGLLNKLTSEDDKLIDIVKSKKKQSFRDQLLMQLGLESGKNMHELLDAPKSE